MSADYGCGVDAVLRAFGDEQYWLARLADSGADTASLDGLQVGADGAVTVSTTQVLHSDRLPGLVAQFHRGDLEIHRRERWDPVRDGRAEATVDGEIPGAPVALTGTAVLTPHGSGSHLTFRADVEVRIPLVGGKIETFIGGQLVELLTAEQRFTNSWLQENPV